MDAAAVAPIEVPAHENDERYKPTMEELRRRFLSAWKSSDEFRVYAKDQILSPAALDEIRTQGEFYFSNNNLVQDEHLWSECMGPKNLPVSFKHICQFNVAAGIISAIAALGATDVTRTSVVSSSKLLLVKTLTFCLCLRERQ